MNVLVTGSTGFVASHYIPRLAQAGHVVIAAGHDTARMPAGERIVTLLWDHSQPAALTSLPLPVDAVVHLAQANVPFPERAEEMFAVHVAATQRLLDVARAVGARRFVFASTGSVYGSGARPWCEDDPTDGTGYYAATKIAAERLVRAYGDYVPFTIFRLFAPYGPGQRNRLIPGLINRVRTGTPVTVAGGVGPAFNPLYVTHVVDVLEQALDATGNQLLNLGGDDALTVREMALAIGRALDKEPIIQEQPGPTERFVGDNSALRRAYRLPIRLTPFEVGIRSMFAP